jgi:hypothetical protein
MCGVNNINIVVRRNLIILFKGKLNYPKSLVVKEKTLGKSAQLGLHTPAFAL